MREIMAFSLCAVFHSFLSPSLPIQVLVIHYENIQSDIAGSLRTLLRFLDLPEDEARVACVERHQRGFFKRRRHDEPEVVAFKKPLRSQVRTSQSSDFIPRRLILRQEN